MLEWKIFFKLIFVIFLLMGKTSSRTPVNVGTVLFDTNDRDKPCWTLRGELLLHARQLMQNMLPDEHYHSFDKSYVTEFIDYVHNTLGLIRSAVHGQTQQALVLALSDVIGGYMRVYLLPMTKHEYYSGNFAYSDMARLYTLYDDVKSVLRTDGSGWKIPIVVGADLNKLPSLRVSKRNLSPDSCDHFLINRDAGVHADSVIPLPYLDDVQFPHSIAIPFRKHSLRSLQAKSSANLLTKYYVSGMKCLLSTASEEDFRTFNERVELWVNKFVTPRLNDEQWYPAFGGVYRVLATTRRVRNVLRESYITTGRTVNFHSGVSMDLPAITEAFRKGLEKVTEVLEETTSDLDEGYKRRSHNDGNLNAVESENNRNKDVEYITGSISLIPTGNHEFYSGSEDALSQSLNIRPSGILWNTRSNNYSPRGHSAPFLPDEFQYYLRNSSDNPQLHRYPSVLSPALNSALVNPPVLQNSNPNISFIVPQSQSSLNQKRVKPEKLDSRFVYRIHSHSIPFWTHHSTSAPNIDTTQQKNNDNGTLYLHFAEKSMNSLKKLRSKIHNEFPPGEDDTMPGLKIHSENSLPSLHGMSSTLPFNSTVTLTTLQNNQTSIANPSSSSNSIYEKSLSSTRTEGTFEYMSNIAVENNSHPTKRDDLLPEYLLRLYAPYQYNLTKSDADPQLSLNAILQKSVDTTLPDLMASKLFNTTSILPLTTLNPVSGLNMATYVTQLPAENPHYFTNLSQDNSWPDIPAFNSSIHTNTVDSGDRSNLNNLNGLVGINSSNKGVLSFPFSTLIYASADVTNSDIPFHEAEPIAVPTQYSNVISSENDHKFGNFTNIQLVTAKITPQALITGNSHLSVEKENSLSLNEQPADAGDSNLFLFSDNQRNVLQPYVINGAHNIAVKSKTSKRSIDGSLTNSYIEPNLSTYSFDLRPSNKRLTNQQKKNAIYRNKENYSPELLNSKIDQESSFLSRVQNEDDDLFADATLNRVREMKRDSLIRENILASSNDNDIPSAAEYQTLINRDHNAFDIDNFGIKRTKDSANVVRSLKGSEESMKFENNVEDTEHAQPQLPLKKYTMEPVMNKVKMLTDKITRSPTNDFGVKNVQSDALNMELGVKREIDSYLNQKELDKTTQTSQKQDNMVRAAVLEEYFRENLPDDKDKSSKSSYSGDSRSEFIDPSKELDKIVSSDEKYDSYRNQHAGQHRKHGTHKSAVQVQNSFRAENPNIHNQLSSKWHNLRNTDYGGGVGVVKSRTGEHKCTGKKRGPWELNDEDEYRDDEDDDDYAVENYKKAKSIGFDETTHDTLKVRRNGLANDTVIIRTKSRLCWFMFTLVQQEVCTLIVSPDLAITNFIMTILFWFVLWFSYFLLTGRSCPCVDFDEEPCECYVDGMQCIPLGGEYYMVKCGCGQQTYLKTSFEPQDKKFEEYPGEWSTEDGEWSTDGEPMVGKGSPTSQGTWSSQHSLAKYIVDLALSQNGESRKSSVESPMAAAHGSDHAKNRGTDEHDTKGKTNAGKISSKRKHPQANILKYQHSSEEHEEEELERHSQRTSKETLWSKDSKERRAPTTQRSSGPSQTVERETGTSGTSQTVSMNRTWQSSEPTKYSSRYKPASKQPKPLQAGDTPTTLVCACGQDADVVRQVEAALKVIRMASCVTDDRRVLSPPCPSMPQPCPKLDRQSTPKKAPCPSGTTGSSRPGPLCRNLMPSIADSKDHNRNTIAHFVQLSSRDSRGSLNTEDLFSRHTSRASRRSSHRGSDSDRGSFTSGRDSIPPCAPKDCRAPECLKGWEGMKHRSRSPLPCLDETCDSTARSYDRYQRSIPCAVQKFDSRQEDLQGPRTGESRSSRPGESRGIRTEELQGTHPGERRRTYPDETRGSRPGERGTHTGELRGTLPGEMRGTYSGQSRITNSAEPRDSHQAERRSTHPGERRVGESRGSHPGEPRETQLRDSRDTHPGEPRRNPTSDPRGTHPSEPRETHASEPRGTYASEPRGTHASEPRGTHASEHRGTHSSEHRATHASEHRGTHLSEQRGTHTGEPRRTHASEPRGTHTSEPRGTHASEPRGTHASEPRGTHTSEPRGTHASEPRGTHASEPRGTHASEPRGTHASEPRGTHASEPRGTHASEPRGTHASEPRGTHASELRGTHASEPRGTHASELRGTHASEFRGTHASEPRGTHASEPRGTQAREPRGTHAGESRTSRPSETHRETRGSYPEDYRRSPSGDQRASSAGKRRETHSSKRRRSRTEERRNTPTEGRHSPSKHRSRYEGDSFTVTKTSGSESSVSNLSDLLEDTREDGRFSLSPATISNASLASRSGGLSQSSKTSTVKQRKIKH